MCVVEYIYLRRRSNSVIHSKEPLFFKMYRHLKDRPNQRIKQEYTWAVEVEDARLKDVVVWVGRKRTE